MYHEKERKAKSMIHEAFKHANVKLLDQGKLKGVDFCNIYGGLATKSLL